MYRRSSVYIYKFFRHSFVGSWRPIVPFSTRALTNLSHKDSATSSSSHLMKFRRKYSVEIDKEVDTINLKFAEAREEIESAMESKETVYFNEEAECAREAVAQVVQLYQGLLNKVSENERALIQRSMGLKIEQLKAELGQLED